MRVLAVALTALVVLAHEASASVRAGPYNFVYYFSIYRAEIELYGFGNSFTAPSCRGSLPDRSCNFDDFCRYVKHPNGQWAGGTNIGNNLTPNPHQAAAELARTNHPNNFDLDKMWPGEFRKGNQPSFSVFMGKGLETLQAIRADPDMTPARLATIERYMVNVVDSFDSIWEERVADIHTKMVQKLQDAVRPQTLTIKSDRTPLPSGDSYQKINLVDTLAANPGLDAQMRQAVLDIHADQTANAGEVHVRALNALQGMADNLYGACGLTGGGNPGISR